MRYLFRLTAHCTIFWIVVMSGNTVEAQSTISYIGSTDYATTGPTETFFDLDVPSGVQAGDLLVMSMYHGASPNPTITAPQDWEQLYQDWTSSGGKHTVFYKFADTSEPSSYGWQLDRTKNIAAGMAAYRGISRSAPFHTQANEYFADVTAVTAELTTTAEGVRLLVFTAAKAAIAGMTPDAEMVKRYGTFSEVRAITLSDEQAASPGTFERSISIDDPDGADEAFTFAVALLPGSVVNEPPSVAGMEDRSAFEGDVVDVQIYATDADSDDLLYSATGLPNGLSMGAADGRITGVIDAGAGASSPFEVTVSVSDGVNTPVDVAFTWTVGANAGVITYLGETSYSSGSTLVTSFDLDVPSGVQTGDLIVMSLFQGANPSPSITAPQDWEQLYRDETTAGGQHTIYYKVADSSEPASYHWEVNPSKNIAAASAAYRGVNPTSPFLAKSSEHAVDETSVTVELTTTIAGARLLVFTAAKATVAGTTPPSTMAERYDVHALERVLSLSGEQPAAPGTLVRSISIDDPDGADELFAFAVELLPEGVENEPPVVDPIADRAGFEGDAVDVQIAASDADGDALTYDAENLPAGLSIDSDGRIAGTIGVGAAASSPYDVMVSASDGVNAPVEVAFTWTVGAEAGEIAYVGSTIYMSAAGSEQSFDLDVPSGVHAGDLLIMSMYHGASPNPTITAPQDWEQLYQDWTGSGGKHTIYYKIADSSEPSSYGWQLDRSKNISAGMAAYRGVSTTSPFQASSTEHVLDADLVTVEVTTTVEGSRLLVFTAAKAATAGMTPEGGMVKRYGTFADVRALAMSDEQLAAPETLVRSISIDDPGGADEAFAFALALSPGSVVNTPPTVDPVADRSDFEGDVVNVQIAATDADDDDLSYAAENLPAGISIDSDGRIAGTVGADAAASSPYEVTVSVSDGVNAPVEVAFTWAIGTETGEIAFVGSTSYSSGSTLVTSFDLDVPSGVQAGDLLIMSMFHGGNPDPVISVPEPWEELYQDWTSTGGKHTVYYKMAGSSEPPFYTWEIDPSKHPAAGMVAYRGVSTTSPFHVQSTEKEVGASSIEVELTTTVAETRLLLFTALKAETGGATPDGSMNERYDEYAFTRTAQMSDERLTSSGTIMRSVSVDHSTGADEAFALAVALLPESLNEPPVVDPIADRAGFEGDAVDVQIAASDADGDALTYDAENLPAGLSIDSDGRIAGTIGVGAAASSPYDVMVSASDGVNAPVEVAFTWTVGAEAGEIAYVGSTIYMSAAGSEQSFDLDVPSGVHAGDLLIMSMYHGASPNPTITAPQDWEQLYQDWTGSGGKHTIYYKIADSSEPSSYGWQLDRSKNISAGMAAYRGVSTTSPFQASSTEHVLDADLVTVEVTTTVEGSRLLVFTAAKAATAGMTPEGGMVKRYGTFADVRALAMSDEQLAAPETLVRSISIDDPGGADEAFAFALALSPGSVVNTPPTVDPVADRSDFEGDVVNVQIAATDADDDDLSYAAENLPAGISIDSDGRIAGTVGADAAASSPYEVTVSVSDGVNAPVEVAFTWAIVEPAESITFLASTSYMSASGSEDNFELDVPSGVQAGDLLVMSMYHGASPNPTITAPQDWERLSQDWTSSGGKHTIYYKVADPSEPSSYGWELDRNKNISAGMAAYRGVNTESPIHALATEHAVGAESVSVELTTSVEGARLLVFTAAKAGTAGMTPQGNLEKRYGTFADVRALAMSDEEPVAPGTHVRTVLIDDPDGADEAFALILALLPLSASPSDVEASIAATKVGHSTTTLGIDEKPLPTEFALRSNYPNPFHGLTTLVFDLPHDSEVAVNVFDVMGRRVLAIPTTRIPAGSSRKHLIDAGSLASGTYLYVLTARSESGLTTRSSKFTLIR